ncbi:alpha/beta fold hydrolase [Deinococcus sp. QL22]|uniref:alpha/beta fold hydrolase n=1 Tax=Deinococcus sp. QL22 TaxID=2939437 RepID=UPI0020172634|nr:alpha/beta hydrolase [Deinococcus sp. QL22]UQN09092.1 alpha/beta hydrolase [Deinococcus sp. QL22]
MHFHAFRRGHGQPLLLLHGLGSNWRTWQPVLDGLSAHREVIAVDLPGSGHTPALDGPVSIATLADAVTTFLHEHHLIGIDVVGNSMGGRLAMELARRSVVGAVVALDPGGFQQGWEQPFFDRTGQVFLGLIRLSRPLMPLLTRTRWGRTLLFAQYSSHPWDIPAELALAEMKSYAASPSVPELRRSLILRGGDVPQGAAIDTLARPMVIAWGHYDRVCLPRQAERALRLFPQAQLYWFEHSGHCPHWDSPAETVDLILKVTGRTSQPYTVRGAEAVGQGIQPSL